MGYLPTHRVGIKGGPMGSKPIGLLLILGPIISLLGWMFVHPGSGGSDSTAATRASEMMADPALARAGILMGFGGMWVIFLGVMTIARGMATAGGPGSSYANVSAILGIILLTLGAMAIGTQLAVVNASSAELGARFMEFDESGQEAFALTCGLLLIFLGIGIALAKNFHVIVAGLATIAGVLFTISPFIDADITGFIGWIAFLITSLALGGLTLKSKS